MDASTTAAAALAIVVDESQQSAMEALLREREQLAMLAAHHESYMAQRHYVGSLQVPLHGRQMTWETAYRQRHNDLAEAHHAMRLAAHALRTGDNEAALARLEGEVGDENSEQSVEDEDMSEADATDGLSTAAGEEEEEEYMEDDAEVEA